MSFTQCLCSNSRSALKAKKKITMEEIRGNFTNIITEIESLLSDINNYSVGVDRDMKEIGKTQKIVQKQRRDIQDKLQELESVIGDINSSKVNVKDVNDRLQQQKVKMEGLKAQLEELICLDDSNLKEEANEQQTRAETMLAKAVKVKEITYKIPVFKQGVISEYSAWKLETKNRVISDLVDSKSTDAHVFLDQTDSKEEEGKREEEVSDEKKTSELLLVIDGKGVVQVQRPNEILVLEDGTAVVSDLGLTFVQRINSSGKLVYKYYSGPGKPALINAIAVCGEFLFILSDKNVTKYHLDNPEEVKGTYKPWINICSFIVPEANCILISEREKGQIIRYDPEKRRSEVAIEGLHRPTYLCYHDTTTERYLVVTEGGTTNRVTVFGKYFAPHARIEGTDKERFKWPRGTTSSPRGTLLVADYNRHTVSEFEMNGTFIRDVITPKDGVLYPMDVACSGDSVWVTQRSPCIKLFKIDNIE